MDGSSEHEKSASEVPPPFSIESAPGYVRATRTLLEGEHRGGGKRGKVSKWTPGSRRRLLRAIAEVEWPDGEVFALGLTYPGAKRGAARRDVQHDFRRLKREYLRQWGEPMRAVWAREWQLRAHVRADLGGEHLHVTLIVPARAWKPSRGGKRPDVVAFTVWARKEWHRIVSGHVNACGCRHARRGAHVKTQKSAYSVRYLATLTGSKGAYQKRLPGTVQNAGRWWGVDGLVRRVETVAVSGSEWVQLRRALRRLARSRGYRSRPHGRYQVFGVLAFGRRSDWRVSIDVLRILVELRTPL